MNLSDDIKECFWCREKIFPLQPYSEVESQDGTYYFHANCHAEYLRSMRDRV